MSGVCGRGGERWAGESVAVTLFEIQVRFGDVPLSAFVTLCIYVLSTHQEVL